MVMTVGGRCSGDDDVAGAGSLFYFFRSRSCVYARKESSEK